MSIRIIEKSTYFSGGVIPREIRFNNGVKDSGKTTNELIVNNGQSPTDATIGDTEGPSVNNDGEKKRLLDEVTEGIRELKIRMPESKNRAQGECVPNLDSGTVDEKNAQGGYTQRIPTPNGLSRSLYRNGDIFRTILPQVENIGALSLGNRELYKAVHHAQEQPEYSQLKMSLDFIFKRKGVLSENQRRALRRILSRVKRAIEGLLEGPEAIQIGRDRVNRIKRAIAVILSGTLKGAQKGTQKLPFPKGLEKLRVLINKDSSVVPLVRELRHAACAYATLLGRCGEIDEFSPHLKEVVKCFKKIPKHYVQHVFDLLETRQDIKESQYIPPCLSEIHKVLYERGDTTLAHLVYSKTSDLLEKYLSDQKLSTPCSTTAVSLGHMLLRERGPKPVVEMIYKLYPGSLRERRDYICFTLVRIVANSGKNDLAHGLADEYYHVSAEGVCSGSDWLEQMHEMIERMKERAQTS